MKALPAGRVCAVACAAGLAVLGGCTSDSGVHVEESAHPLPESHASSAEALNAEHTYTAAQLRTVVLETHSAPVTDNLETVRNQLRNCPSCLTDKHLLRVDRTVFQQATVSPDTKSKPFAAILFATEKSRPRIKLAVTGSDVTMVPGRNNTLIVQESIFRKGDRPCCASQWAVTVYRLTSGGFDAGQRIVHSAPPHDGSTDRRTRGPDGGPAHEPGPLATARPE